MTIHRLPSFNQNQTAEAITAIGSAFANTVRAAMGQWETEVCPFCHLPLNMGACDCPDCFMFGDIIPLPERKWVPM